MTPFVGGPSIYSNIPALGTKCFPVFEEKKDNSSFLKKLRNWSALNLKYQGNLKELAYLHVQVKY